MRNPSATRLLLVSSALLGLAGCRTPAEDRTVVPAPAGFAGFPTPAHAGEVWARAAFVTNHARLLGADLTREGILPVRLTVGRRGSAEGAPRVVAEAIDPHLYLQDGTVLEWVPAGEVARGGRARERVAELALPLTLLAPWDSAPSGFLFFRIPASVRVRDLHALSSAGGRHRELRLSRSLLAFAVLTDEGTRRIHVGLTEERLPER
ncbi:MAG: hypothetical protein AB1726_09055 [Planctomycetota bacterium]